MEGETVSSPSSVHEGGPAMTLHLPADANPDMEPGTHSSVETEVEQPLMSLAVCLWLLVVVTTVRACRDDHA